VYAAATGPVGDAGDGDGGDGGGDGGIVDQPQSPYDVGGVNAAQIAANAAHIGLANDDPRLFELPQANANPAINAVPGDEGELLGTPQPPQDLGIEVDISPYAIGVGNIGDRPFFEAERREGTEFGVFSEIHLTDGQIQTLGPTASARALLELRRRLLINTLRNPNLNRRR
jgi:hypothetical protein